MLVNHPKRLPPAVFDRGKQLRSQTRKLIQRLCEQHELSQVQQGAVKPFPITHNLIRLAQYSFAHHSNKRRRVSRPTKPPSSSSSLLVDVVDGAGEAILDGIGEGLLLVEGVL